MRFPVPDITACKGENTVMSDPLQTTGMLEIFIEKAASPAIHSAV